jgi:hypothetical protein
MAGLPSNACCADFGIPDLGLDENDVTTLDCPCFFEMARLNGCISGDVPIRQLPRQCSGVSVVDGIVTQRCFTRAQQGRG